MRSVRGTASGKPTVLVTGASGVIGSALLPKLAGHRVICLSHTAAVHGPGVRTLRGDIRAPRLGLSRAAYRDLAAAVEVVVHAAAATGYGTMTQLRDTNIVGTGRILDLVAEADARLIHVSTAFVATGDSGSPALAHARSKAEAEDLVRTGGLPATIVRPSTVVGDSRTGRIARHQAFHEALGAVMRGLFPLAPLAPARLLDFVPQDVVADALAGLLYGGEQTGQVRPCRELWLTAGPQALTLGEVVSEVVALSRELGHSVPPVRFVAPEQYERLALSVALGSLPAPARLTLVGLVERLSAHMAVRHPFPSDLTGPGGLPALPDQRLTLRRSMRNWAASTGFARQPVGVRA